MLFWVEKSDSTQTLVIIILLASSLSFFFTGSWLLRFRLLLIFTLANPLLNSLSYSFEQKGFKIAFILVFALVPLVVNSKKLLHLFTVFTITNMVFCCFLMATYFSTSFTFNTSQKLPSIAKIIAKDDANKDIFILILDAFSSKDVMKKYFNSESKFLNYLDHNGFKEMPPLSKYPHTSYSLPNIFSGVTFPPKSTFKTKDTEEIQKLLPGNYLKKYVYENKYALVFNSFITDEKNQETRKIFGRGNDFEIYFFSLINRIRLSFFSTLSKQNIGIEEISAQNKISMLKILNEPSKTLSVHHFLTFHHTYFDNDFQTIFKKNLVYADTLAISTIKMIIDKKPDAKIIVLSDHAERGGGISNEDTLKGILYVRN